MLQVHFFYQKYVPHTFHNKYVLLCTMYILVHTWGEKYVLGTLGKKYVPGTNRFMLVYIDTIP